LERLVKARFDQFEIDSQTRQLTRARGDPLVTEGVCRLVRPHREAPETWCRRPTCSARSGPRSSWSKGTSTYWSARSGAQLGDDAQEQRFIRTVHGVGYAFCAKATNIDRGAPAEGPPPVSGCRGRPAFALAEGDTIIGRDPRSQVWLDHSGVSRRHAQIRMAGLERPVLTDLGSTNGTFVHGERVDGQHRSRTATSIKVGSVTVNSVSGPTGPHARNAFAAPRGLIPDSCFCGYHSSARARRAGATS
jgi:hypothetical protein